MRRASFLAGMAMLLQITALFLTWWVATNQTFGASDGFGLWSRPPGDLNLKAVWVTDALAILPIPFLFVRLAARSIVHEPKAWRRDLGVATALMIGALASAWFWPLDTPFWGTKTFGAADGVDAQVIEAHPGLGWWVGAAAAAAAAWSLWLGRPQHPPAGDEPSP